MICNTGNSWKKQQDATSLQAEKYESNPTFDAESLVTHDRGELSKPTALLHLPFLQKFALSPADALQQYLLFMHSYAQCSALQLR